MDNIISFDEWSRKCQLQITLCDPEFREKAKYIWDSAMEAQAQKIKELESFRTAYMEWSDKTDWVRTDKRFDILKPWGKHRADVLKEYIQNLESHTTMLNLVQPSPEHYSMLDTVTHILDGIDRVELDNGWWETSTGAKFGKEKLEKVREAVLNHQQPEANSTSKLSPALPESCVTAEHRRVIEMLLSVCGAAFELADDSCQQDVDGENCHVVPDNAFQKLSDALDEIENTLPTEVIDRPNVILAWSAMPREALKSLLCSQLSQNIPEEQEHLVLLETVEHAGDEVIGVGSLQGWTRSQVTQEYSEIVKAAENGGKSLDEWDAMRDVLCKLYVGTSCERFSSLVRLFLFGRFQQLMSKDIGGVDEHNL